MIVYVIVLLNLEAANQPYEDEIKFSVSEKRARAHAIADPVREKRRIRLLDPARWAENFWITPHGGI